MTGEPRRNPFSMLKGWAYEMINRLLAGRGLVLARAERIEEQRPLTPPLPRDYYEEMPFDGLIDYNEGAALDILKNTFPAYATEYRSFPREPSGEPGAFYLDNDFFGPVDAEVLYCMVRHFKPGRIVEVGSGYSTLVMRMALDENRTAGSRLICIDPSPRASIEEAADHIINRPVEQAGIDAFRELGDDDFLFVDSSHTVGTGGDLNFIFFQVLPLLRPGVLIHFHDICLPRDYLYEWVVTEGRHYTEQYLLLAFLMNNREYHVLWPGLYMMLKHPAEILEAFPSCDHVTAPVSFWIEKSP